MRNRAIIVASIVLVGAILLLFLWGNPTTPPYRPDGSPAITEILPTVRPFSHPDDSGGVEKREVIVAEMTSFPHEKGQFISGIVFNAAGKPQPGAKCSLILGRSVLEEDSPIPAFKGDDAFSPISTVLSDTDGNFQIPARGGFWRLRVEYSWYPPWEEDSLHSGDFRWVHLQGGVELSILVRNEKGSGIEGVELETLRTPYSQPSGVRMRATTDSSGMARLLVAPGLLNLSARHSEYRVKVESWHVSRDPSQQQQEIVLNQGIQIYGRVRLSGDLDPPSGTLVRIETTSYRQGLTEVPCLGNGKFSTDHLFRPGQTVEVIALAPGFGESRKEVTIPNTMPAGGRYAVDFDLKGGERLAIGRILEPTGVGMRRVPLFLKAFRVVPEEEAIRVPASADPRHVQNVDKRPVASKNSQWRWAGETKEDGSFLIGGMAPQIPYSLLVIPQGSANVQLWIPKGQSGEVLDLGVVQTSPSASICGVVTDGEGRPLSSIEVSSIEIDERDIAVGQIYQIKRPTALRGGWSDVTNRAGEFRIEPLPPGKYMLSIGEKMFGPYDLSGGQNRGPEVLVLPVDPNLDGKQAFQIKGRILGEAGASATHLLAKLFQQREGQDPEFIRGRVVEAGGRIALTTSLPGPYFLQVVDLEGTYETAELLIAKGREESVELTLQNRSSLPHVLEGVVFGSDGTPLSGIKVSLKFSPSLIPCSCYERTSISDQSGAFSFGSVIEGPHKLFVSDPNGEFHSMEYFPAIPGDFVSLNLEN